MEERSNRAYLFHISSTEETDKNTTTTEIDGEMRKSRKETKERKALIDIWTTKCP